MKLFICATLLLASSQFASADLIAGVVNLFDGFKVPGTDVELLGCFQDGGTGLPFQPPRVFSGGFTEYKDTEVIEKCYKEAVKNGVNTFAIQFGKQCFAKDKKAEEHYNKLGKPLIAACMDGRGGLFQNDVYHIKTAAGGYKHVGCWTDNIFDRAVPELDGKFPTLKDAYQGRADAIHKCYEVAKKEGLKIFAVQHGGWCAGSKDMEAYKKYGAATNCKDGKGGGSSNDVYTIDGAAPPATEAPLPAITGMCPKSHPNAYLKGKHCCKFNFEKVAAVDGDLCDGSAIGFTSKCCKNDAHTGCPNGVCGNYKAPTPAPVAARTECPDNGHMYPGDNLENPAASSWQECANHCGKNSKCKAFTFTVATKRCSLKAVIKQVKVKEGKISGSYLCAAEMKDWKPTSAPVIRPATQAPVTAPPQRTIKHIDPHGWPDDGGVTVPMRPATQRPVTAPPARTIVHVDPVPAPAKDVYKDTMAGCWDWYSDNPATGKWKWIGYEMTAGRRAIVAHLKKTYTPEKIEDSDDKTGIFPASEGWFKLNDRTAWYYAKNVGNGQLKWFKFSKAAVHCTSRNYKGVKNYCADWGHANNRRTCPTPKFADNKGNLECSNYSAQGCYKSKSSFVRNDRQLLVYWRHDITWKSIRAFTKSLVCTCAKAAKSAGVKYYAVHYWGECWAINMNDFAKNNGGDCIRDYGKKCNGNNKRMCLADKDFQVYKTA